MQMVSEKRPSLRVAVDRREGKVLVLRDDSGKVYDVPAAILPQPCRNTGAQLEVPLDGTTPRWSGAKRLIH